MQLSRPWGPFPRVLRGRRGAIHSSPAPNAQTPRGPSILSLLLSTHSLGNQLVPWKSSVAR